MVNNDDVFIVSGGKGPKIATHYCEIYKKYIEKYGEKTVILMQVGDFYEIYGVDNDIETWGNVREIARICNFSVTKKNKNLIENDRGNPLMSGIPLHAKPKYIPMLLSANYTIVMVEHINLGPYTKENPCQRAVTEIISPSTCIEDEIDARSNNLLCIYVENMTPKMNRLDKSLFSIGMTSLDLSTNHGFIYESYSRKDDSNQALDEVYRFIQAQNPREIVVYLDNFKLDFQYQNREVESSVVNKLNQNQLLQKLRNELESDGDSENSNVEQPDIQSLDKIEYHIRNYFIKYLDLQKYNVHKIHINNVDNVWKKVAYQNQFLNRIFKPNNLLTPIEYLDLEFKPFALIAYMLALQFAYERNEKIIEKMEKPKQWNFEKHLVLTTNAIQQLDLIHKDRTRKSLFAIINHASTPMGERLLEYQLLNPIVDAQKLTTRYNRIGLLKEQNKDARRVLQHILQDIGDIERMYRKMSLGLLTPFQFNVLHSYHENINKLVEWVGTCKIKDIVPNNTIINNFKLFIKEYNNTFHIDDMRSYISMKTIDRSFFCSGVNQNIDNIEIKIQSLYKQIVDIQMALSNLVDTPSKKTKKPFVTLAKQSKDGYYFTVTKTRGAILTHYCNEIKKHGNKVASKLKIRKFVNAKHLQKHIVNETDNSDEEDDDDDANTSVTNCQYLSQGEINILKNLRFENLRKSFKIFSPQVAYLSSQLSDLESSINSVIRQEFSKIQVEFYDKYKDSLSSITNFVAETDVIKSHTKTAILHNYHRPEIFNSSKKNKTECSSFIDTKQIRHPIIEQIQQHVMYVPNDIYVGNNDEYKSDMKNNGTLLYGTNNSGKTSLLKSLGLNLILAQSGSFVAANKFIYYPFSTIVTRLSGNDNLYKGQGTFAVAMSELRTIFMRSNKNTLVLGDEICHGTTQVDGLSLIAASISDLAAVNTNFVFATHLHTIPKLNAIKILDNVKNFHLRVTCDEVNDCLVYDRTIYPGQGASIYGIEVAKAMGVPKKTIEKALRIRKEIMGLDKDILNPKKSHFNANVYVDKCVVCGEKAIDTHHVKEQHLADENGMIGHFHKNIAHNVTPLCKGCHNDAHHGKLVIKGYKVTTKGIQLEFERPKKRRKVV